MNRPAYTTTVPLQDRIDAALARLEADVDVIMGRTRDAPWPSPTLAMRIAAKARARGLTQKQTAHALGITQSGVSYQLIAFDRRAWLLRHHYTGDDR